MSISIWCHKRRAIAFPIWYRERSYKIAVLPASKHDFSNPVPRASVHHISRLFSYCEHRPSVSPSLPCSVLFGTSRMGSLCIFSPFRYRGRSSFLIWYRERRSANRAGVYVAVVWVVATAACVPPMIGWTDQQNYVWKNASATFQCEPFQTPGSSVRLSVCPLIRHVSFMRHF